MPSGILQPLMERRVGNSQLFRHRGDRFLQFGHSLHGLVFERRIVLLSHLPHLNWVKISPRETSSFTDMPMSTSRRCGTLSVTTCPHSKSSCEVRKPTVRNQKNRFLRRQGEGGLVPGKPRCLDTPLRGAYGGECALSAEVNFEPKLVCRGAPGEESTRLWNEPLNPSTCHGLQSVTVELIDVLATIQFNAHQS